MNTPSIPHSDNSICLPTYAEANANRDSEAQQQQYRSCGKSIWQKSKLFSIYAIGVLIILVPCGVFAYEMYIQYRRSRVSKWSSPEADWCADVNRSTRHITRHLQWITIEVLWDPFLTGWWYLWTAVWYNCEPPGFLNASSWLLLSFIYKMWIFSLKPFILILNRMMIT